MIVQVLNKLVIHENIDIKCSISPCYNGNQSLTQQDRNQELKSPTEQKLYNIVKSKDRKSGICRCYYNENLDARVESNPYYKKFSLHSGKQCVCAERIVPISTVPE